MFILPPLGFCCPGWLHHSSPPLATHLVTRIFKKRYLSVGVKVIKRFTVTDYEEMLGGCVQVAQIHKLIRRSYKIIVFFMSACVTRTTLLFNPYQLNTYSVSLFVLCLFKFRLFVKCILLQWYSGQFSFQRREQTRVTYRPVTATTDNEFLICIFLHHDGDCG